MSALTVTRPTPTGTRTEVVNHWVRKSAILAGVVTGEAARALCGQSFVPSSQGGGSAADTTASVCPLCESVYDGLLP
ncbi:DUF3039 domain-containing protein [Aneurinibacillus sp. BA2021]|nr:DUF3039 domain-containing protein [Aneurinibacillus sp. BA2021]